MPDKEQLKAALAAAGSAHHDYETNYLKGTRDEQWAGWYAAFVIGRLGDFMSPTDVARSLEEVTGDGDWSENAASHVLEKE